MLLGTVPRNPHLSAFVYIDIDERHACVLPLIPPCMQDTAHGAQLWL